MNRQKAGWRSILAVALMACSCASHAGSHDDAVQEAQKLIDQVKQLYTQGDYQQAQPMAKRALEIREKELGPEHADTAAALHQLGLLNWVSGAYSQAESLYQRALAIREKTLGPEHPETARTISNLGAVYYSTGAFAKAEPLYQRALTIREKVMGPEHSDTALTLNNLAILYDNTGANAKAEPLYQRALAIREKVMGPAHPDTAQSLNNLAVLYRETGLYTKAEPLFQRGLAICEKTLGPEHPDTANSLSNLALVYVDTGAYTKAETLLKRAINIYDKALGPGHPDTADAVVNLARLYTNSGEYVKAELLYQRARAIREKALGPRHPDTLTTVNGLAQLNWRAGNTAKALALFKHTQFIQSENAENFLLLRSEARNQAYLQAMTDDVFTYVSFSVAMPGHQSVALGLNSVLQYKGRLLDATSDNVSRLRRCVNPKDGKIFDQLAEVATRFSNLTYQGAGDLSPQEYQQRLNNLSQQQETLQAALASRSGEFRVQVMPITIESVRRAIPANSVLVEWLRYLPFDPNAISSNIPPHYVAYVLKHSGQPIVVDIGEAEEIEELVREFRGAVSESNRSDVKARAIALSDKVLKPLRPYLNGAERLLMSPDGALNLVPMAALVDEMGDYLAEHVEVTYLTSGRDLLRFASEARSHSAVVIAGPDYGKPTQLLAQTDSLQPQRSAELDRSGLIFRPLGNTVLEAQALKNLLTLDDASVLLGQYATEANLKQLHGPHILHVASHGFFLNDQELAKLRGSQQFVQSENPLLRSGIALAGANERRSGAKDDGILTALEAAQLDLHGTELVVLSACDSGVGQVQNGEGVYGLRRASTLAGAQTQIMSLWKVSDESTSKLMVDYYQRLLQGESRSAALYHAQKTLLASPNESHPYYWAGFVSIGNVAPLPKLRR